MHPLTHIALLKDVSTMHPPTHIALLKDVSTMHPPTHHGVEVRREMLVLLDGGVGGVQVVGQGTDDENGEDDEEGDGDLLLLGQDDVLLQGGVLLQALGVGADGAEHPRVAVGQDDDRDEDVRHLPKE